MDKTEVDNFNKKLKERSTSELDILDEDELAALSDFYESKEYKILAKLLRSSEQSGAKDLITKVNTRRTQFMSMGFTASEASLKAMQDIESRVAEREIFLLLPKLARDKVKNG